jgi:hypothetical protein
MPIRLSELQKPILPLPQEAVSESPAEKLQANLNWRKDLRAQMRGQQNLETMYSPTRALYRGVYQFGSMAKGALGLASSALEQIGVPDMAETKKWYYEESARLGRKAEEYPILKMGDVLEGWKTPIRAAQFAMEQFITNLPYMGATMLTGGGLAWGTGKILGSATGENVLARVIAGQTGVVLSTAALEGGSNWAEAMDRHKDNPAAAIVTGMLAGIIEIGGGNMRWFERMFGAKEAGKISQTLDRMWSYLKRDRIPTAKDLGYMRQVFRTARTVAKEEAIQEAMQEGLSITNLALADPSFSAWTKESFQRVLESAVGGAAAASISGPLGYAAGRATGNINPTDMVREDLKTLDSGKLIGAAKQNVDALSKEPRNADRFVMSHLMLDELAQRLQPAAEEAKLRQSGDKTFRDMLIDWLNTSMIPAKRAEKYQKLVKALETRLAKAQGQPPTAPPAAAPSAPPGTPPTAPTAPGTAVTPAGLPPGAPPAAPGQPPVVPGAPPAAGVGVPPPTAPGVSPAAPTAPPGAPPSVTVKIPAPYTGPEYLRPTDTPLELSPHRNKKDMEDLYDWAVQNNKVSTIIEMSVSGSGTKTIAQRTGLSEEVVLAVRWKLGVPSTADMELLAGKSVKPSKNAEAERRDWKNRYVQLRVEEWLRDNQEITPDTISDLYKVSKADASWIIQKAREATGIQAPEAEVDRLDEFSPNAQEMVINELGAKAFTWYEDIYAGFQGARPAKSPGPESANYPAYIHWLVYHNFAELMKQKGSLRRILGQVATDVMDANAKRNQIAGKRKELVVDINYGQDVVRKAYYEITESLKKRKEAENAQRTGTETGAPGKEEGVPGTPVGPVRVRNVAENRMGAIDAKEVIVSVAHNGKMYGNWDQAKAQDETIVPDQLEYEVPGIPQYNAEQAQAAQNNLANQGVDSVVVESEKGVFLRIRKKPTSTPESSGLSPGVPRTTVIPRKETSHGMQEGKEKVVEAPASEKGEPSAAFTGRVFYGRSSPPYATAEEAEAARTEIESKGIMAVVEKREKKGKKGPVVQHFVHKPIRTKAAAEKKKESLARKGYFTEMEKVKGGYVLRQRQGTAEEKETFQKARSEKIQKTREKRWATRTPDANLTLKQWLSRYIHARRPLFVGSDVNKPGEGETHLAAWAVPTSEAWKKKHKSLAQRRIDTKGIAEALNISPMLVTANPKYHHMPAGTYTTLEFLLHTFEETFPGFGDRSEVGGWGNMEAFIDLLQHGPKKFGDKRLGDLFGVPTGKEEEAEVTRIEAQGREEAIQAIIEKYGAEPISDEEMERLIQSYLEGELRNATLDQSGADLDWIIEQAKKEGLLKEDDTREIADELAPVLEELGIEGISAEDLNESIRWSWENAPETWGTMEDIDAWFSPFYDVFSEEKVYVPEEWAPPEDMDAAIDEYISEIARGVMPSQTKVEKPAPPAPAPAPAAPAVEERYLVKVSPIYDAVAVRNPDGPGWKVTVYKGLDSPFLKETKIGERIVMTEAGSPAPKSADFRKIIKQTGREIAQTYEKEYEEKEKPAPKEKPTKRELPPREKVGQFYVRETETGFVVEDKEGKVVLPRMAGEEYLSSTEAEAAAREMTARVTTQEKFFEPQEPRGLFEEGEEKPPAKIGWRRT